MGCGGSKEATPAPTSGSKPAAPASKAPASNPVVARSQSWRERQVPGVDGKTADVASMPTYSTGGGGGDAAFFGLLAEKKADDWKPTAKERPILSVHPSDDLAGKAGAKDKLYLLEGIAMTVPYRVIFAGDEARKTQVEASLKRIFDRINTIYNNWNSDSEIEKAVATAAAQFAKGSPISQELYDFLKMGEELVSVSGGRFDPTVAPISKLWHKALETKGQPPAPSELGPLSFALGWKNVQLKTDANGCRLFLKNGNTRLDLGGYSKGHAVDLICDDLKAGGLGDFMVEWGGDIKAFGKHPEGRPWRTAVIRPPPLKPLFKLWAEGKILDAITPDLLHCTASLEGLSIATSGDYFQIQKFGYHHILHPGAKQPMRANETGVASVSVVAKSCAAADAYATAAFVCGSVAECSKFLKTLKSEGRIVAYAVFGRKGQPVLEGSMFETSAASASAGAVAPEQVVLQDQAASGNVLDALRDLNRAIQGAKSNLSIGGRAETVDCSGFDLCSVDPLLVSVVVDASSLVLHGGAEAGSKARVGLPDLKMVVEGRVHSLKMCGPTHQLVLLEVTSVFDAANLSNPSAPSVALKTVMKAIASPVTVVTFRAITGSAHAITATSARFVDASGAFLFNVQKASKVHLGLSGIEGSETAIHVLSAGQEKVGQTYSKETDFDATAFTSTVYPGGEVLHADDHDRAPQLSPAGRAFTGKITELVDAGDHTIVLGTVLDVRPTDVPTSMLLAWKDRAFVQASSL